MVRMQGWFIYRGVILYRDKLTRHLGHGSHIGLTDLNIALVLLFPLSSQVLFGRHSEATFQSAHELGHTRFLSLSLTHTWLLTLAHKYGENRSPCLFRKKTVPAQTLELAGGRKVYLASQVEYNSSENRR